MSFHCHGFTGQRGSFNAFSLSWLRKAAGFFQCLFIVMVSQGNGILSMSFHCHGFTGQWGSFKVRHCHGFTGQWDFEGSGILYFNQCLFIVMVSQGNGILRAVGFFISMSFHCRAFTGQWDSEGSGILYFNVCSLSWFHRALGFFQYPAIVITPKVPQMPEPWKYHGNLTPSCPPGLSQMLHKLKTPCNFTSRLSAKLVTIAPNMQSTRKSSSRT